MSIKCLLKAIIPPAILRWRRNYIQTRMRIDVESAASAKEAFTKIYEKGYWGRASDAADEWYSGSGSHLTELVQPYVAAVVEFLKSLNQPNVVDLGCGDFAVGRQIRPYCGKYIAADLVDGLIKRNREKFSEEDVEFRVIDIIEDDFPPADVVFIRQVLQHLSNEDIAKVVKKLPHSFRYLILTEHLPDASGFTPNLEKPRGENIRIDLGEKGSGVVLTEPPFNLNVKHTRVLCEVREDMAYRPGVIRTVLYEL